jgi:phosphatidylserine/phosphatidylglycerophosphate/cardiolipin synthase-like enzyme
VRSVAVFAVVVLAGVFGGFTLRSSPPARSSSASPAATGALSLITEPQAGIAPVLRAISGARRSVDLVMYEDEDTQVDGALVADAARGIRVRVLLNGGYYRERSDVNDPAYDDLRTHHVPVRWTPSYFALTHEKALVVDGRAYILTFNFTPRYYAADRDLGVIDGDRADVSAIERTFTADWNGRRIDAPPGRDLVWSPGSAQAQLALIGSARAGAQLDVYNEEMDSRPVEQALEAAARRGAHVNVVMTYASEWKAAFAALTAAGVLVRTYAQDAPLYIHAKMILTGARAFVGSENFSTTSLDDNRELGIVIGVPAIIRSLRATFARDFAGARPFAAS